MRPVNKGPSPYDTIQEYAEALPYLESVIGLYCSYCEFPISHVPEVEHISAKKKGGDETNWSNLLLGCKYCNTRKGTKVTPENVERHLWPDNDNTALAYVYDGGIPKVNKNELDMLDPSGTLSAKAQTLFAVVDLGHVPAPNEKDRRFRQRNKAYELALDSLRDWQEQNKVCPKASEGLKNQIVRTATATGFFSIWMTVFAGEADILCALIEAFPGTNRKCFNDEGKAVRLEST